jgi:hypothetical protein
MPADQVALVLLVVIKKWLGWFSFFENSGGGLVRLLVAISLASPYKKNRGTWLISICSGPAGDKYSTTARNFPSSMLLVSKLEQREAE